ncbi:carboxymuconolactone decarboxylase family protein [Paenibacillus sp. PR3]|uniref:Carboxymuconolactone decarboxylase family protein n=1 Tax=Paenibacillus terricola TaxID=2763503 RepID=A0ABR8N0K1_9BACL|nr:carboxymuconolactone decarboxylase family protein [Paenibacillus terricola]MBD3921717.1 carboxymuconolactone decarboxylase family protein [Paenibacillus terricola]
MNSSYAIGKKLFQETDEAGIQSVIDHLSDVSPHISRYIIEVFGQLFSRPVLTYQQREMIVIAALISLGDTPNQLKWHMNFGLKVGITPNEMIEISTHCIPFCGFPRALNAINVAKQLFAEQHIEVNIEDELLQNVGERQQRGLAKLQEIDGKHGEDVADSLADIAPLLAEQIIEFTFGEIYSRSGLSPKLRQLVTLGALTAQGGCEPQLHVHLNAAIHVGLTRQEVIEALLQCSPYTGFPKVLNAIKVAKEIFLSH